MPRAVRMAVLAALFATPLTIFTASTTIMTGGAAHAGVASLSDTVRGYRASFYADLGEFR